MTNDKYKQMMEPRPYAKQLPAMKKDAAPFAEKTEYLDALTMVLIIMHNIEKELKRKK